MRPRQLVCQAWSCLIPLFYDTSGRNVACLICCLQSGAFTGQIRFLLLWRR